MDLPTEFIASAVKLLLLPPASLFLLGFVGWLLRRRRPLTGRVLMSVSVVLLVALSTPWVGYQLYDRLSDYPAIALDREKPRADAIVILSAGTYYAGEYGGDVPDADTMERIRYGARLYRALGLPILVTGGTPAPDRPAVADVMADTLASDFAVTARWRETAAQNTLENARLSAAILRAAGIRSVYLVTHADHMRRALAAFRSAGLSAIPAPVGVPPSHYEFEAADLVPSARGLYASSAAIYEYLARVWYFYYRLRGAA